MPQPVPAGVRIQIAFNADGRGMTLDILPPPAQVTPDEPAVAAAAEPAIAEVRPSGITLDPFNHVVAGPGGSEALTGRQALALREFLVASDRVLRRAEASRRVLGRSPDAAGRALDQVVSQLRQKVARVSRGRLGILALAGTGYRLVEAPHPSISVTAKGSKR